MAFVELGARMRACVRASKLSSRRDAVMWLNAEDGVIKLSWLVVKLNKVYLCR